LDLARRTAQWLRHDESRQTPADVIRMCVTASYAAVDRPPPPEWDSDRETEPAFMARQKAYRVEVKRRANAAGRVAARSLSRKHAAERDFEWLALFQVGRLEHVDIKERCKPPRPSVDAIRDAITAAAADAGVHLRAARRGRRPDR
jgi:hypothetical protein